MAYRAALLLIVFGVLAGNVRPVNSAADTPAAKMPMTAENDGCGDPVTSSRGGHLTSHMRFTKCTYPAKLRCQWDLVSVSDDPDARLNFSFASYEMAREKQPCESNYLRFYDGHSSTSKIIKTFCDGRTIPEKFTSFGNKVRVEFQAGTFAAKGFKLMWDKYRPCKNDGSDFVCDDKVECISKESRCDGGKGEFIKDCSDGSDEKNCPILANCPIGQQLCDHRLKCFNDELKCDGINDCRDGSDEKNCPDAKCDKSNQFICSHRKKCYNDTQRCNGVDDCRDNSDETPCSPKVCKPDEFRCNHKYACIKKSYLCDAVKDCVDGSDEWNCPKSITCDPKTQFACANNMVCVSKGLQCDGKNDCRSDGSDEAGCKKVQRCHPDEIQCAHYLSCIKVSKVCDGVKDCTDDSDENKCMDDGTRCKESQFKCKKRAVCVDNSEVCDKRNDCMDNSDEENCLYLNGTGPICAVNHIWCPKRSRCIKASLACNGRDDCGDNTDEANCPGASDNVCKMDWVKCQNEQYINLAKRCDRAARCIDGTHTNSPTPC